MRRFAILMGMISFFVPANAQTVKLPSGSGDCPHAIELGTDTFFGPVTAPIGGGELEEVSDGNDQSLYFFYKEHNTVWYHFVVPDDALLELDIQPVHAADDVDFLLFRKEGEMFCERLRYNEVLPLRTNISRVDSLHGGMTGLKSSASRKYIHGGPGDAYSQAVRVLKGEEYYLVVDHFRKHKTGHSIMLHYKTLKSQSNTVLEGKKHELNMFSGKAGLLSITVSDAQTGLPLNAHIEIYGAAGNKPLRIPDAKAYLLELDKYKSYTVNCSKKGYLYFTRRIVTGAKRQNISLDIALQPIAEGQKITLNDIYFKGDKADILPNSESALKTLLHFLYENPEVKIEIQGHVNAKRNNKKARQLSKDRAAAVYYYLVLKDIPKNRMEYKGYGNTKMIYPDPMDARQAAANRRVEIRILSTR